MKIEGNRHAHETEALARAEANKAKQPSQSRAADKGDRVDVSEGAKQAQNLVATAVKAAQALPDVRPEAVARGKALLESGTLGDDPGKLADAIIDDLLK